MATVSERLALIINFNGDAAIKGLDGVAKKAEGAHESTRKLSDSMTKVGAVGLAASGVAAAGLFKLAGKASDLNEVISKSQVLFGDAADEVEKWASGAATSIGQSKRAALEAATTFANLGRNAGLSGLDLANFSTKLTELGGDLASFNNSSPEEAVMALGAALRGESEPIRRFGVQLDEATLKQRALAMGLIDTTSGTLPPAIKMQAAYAEILAQTTAAQGDFARTSDGAANQQRILKAELENMATGIGTGLLPMLQGALHGATSLVGAFNGLDPATQSLIGKFAGVGVAGLGAVSTISLLAGQAIKMKERFTDGAGSLTFAGKAAAGAGIAFTVVGGALALLSYNANKATVSINDLAKKSLPEISGQFKETRDAADLAAKKIEAVNEAARKGRIDQTRLGTAAIESVKATRKLADVNNEFQEVLAKAPEYAQKFIDAAKAAGFETSGWESQLAKLKTDTAEHKDLLAEYNTQVDATRAANEGASASTTDLTEKTQAQREEEERHKKVLDDQQKALDELTAAQDRQRKARREAYDDVRAQTDLEFAYARSQRDTRDAAREAEEKIKDATKAKGKDAEKNDDAIAASDELIQKILEEAHAYAESTGAVDGSRDSIDKQVGKLTELRDSYAEKFPQIAAQIDTYIGKLKEAASASTTLVVPGFETNYHGKRAAGGPVSARQTYLVGEKGPELFMPDGPGRIVPNDQTMGALAGGGGVVVINAHFNGLTDARAVAKALGAEFAWRLKVGA
jgi:uncharacterized coiled-coil DUF342 family protein